MNRSGSCVESAHLPQTAGLLGRTAPVLALLALCLVLALPLLLFGPLSNAHDGQEQVNYSRYFTQQLWAGELYPRWLAGMNHGLGSPSFFVYPPLPSYVRALLDPLGTLLHFSAFNVAAFLSLFGSGVFAYFWLRNTFDRWLAFSGAALYMIAPYHLATDFYARFALSECWALVWLPLIMLFTENLLRGRRRAFAGLAASYALLILSHPPTALMFVPVLLAMAMVWPDSGRKLQSALCVSAALLLGIGMSGIYVLPAFTHHQYISASKLFAAYGYLPANGLITFGSRLFSKSPQYEFISKLSWVVLEVLLLLVVCAAVVVRSRRPELKKMTWFWVFVCAFAAFCMSQLSDPFWRLIPQMTEAFQFPYRFNALLCLSIVPVLAAFLRILLSQPPHRRWLFAVFGLGVALWLAAWGRECSHYATETASPLSLDFDVTDGWFAAWVQPNLDREAALLASRQPKARLDAEGTVTVIKWKPRHIELLSSAPNGGLITLSQFYYPAWRARIDGHAAVPIATPQPDGLIRVRAPRGVHVFAFLIPFSLSERLGLWISAASGILCIGLLVVRRREETRGPARSLSFEETTI